MPTWSIFTGPVTYFIFSSPLDILSTAYFPERWFDLKAVESLLRATYIYSEE